MTRIGWRAFVNSTTLESNKSQQRYGDNQQSGGHAVKQNYPPAWLELPKLKLETPEVFQHISAH